jgi:hypothetical protein
MRKIFFSFLLVRREITAPPTGREAATEGQGAAARVAAAWEAAARVAAAWEAAAMAAGSESLVRLPKEI